MLSLFTPTPIGPKAAFKGAQFPAPGEPSEIRPGAFSGLPGDVGFDPLGLANFDLLLGSAEDKQRSAAVVMRDYRDAELKHGRLAMLAAVAWPLQEKLNPILAAKFHLPNLVAEAGGRSPSVLNGGLGQGIIPSAVITFAVLVALVEAQGLRIKQSEGDAWMPGDYGTLRVAERGSEQFFSLQEGEIWNARVVGEARAPRDGHRPTACACFPYVPAFATPTVLCSSFISPRRPYAA